MNNHEKLAEKIAYKVFDLFVSLKSNISILGPQKNEILIQRLKGFPEGCCVDASIVLREILEEHCILNSTFISQTYGLMPYGSNSSNHVWLKYNGWNFDLTFRQFIKDYKEGVFIKEIHPLERDDYHAILSWPERWKTGKHCEFNEYKVNDCLSEFIKSFKSLYNM